MLLAAAQGERPTLAGGRMAAAPLLEQPARPADGFCIPGAELQEKHDHRLRLLAINQATELLDDLWATFGSQDPGALDERVHRLDRLRTATLEAAAIEASSRALLLRRLATHVEASKDVAASSQTERRIAVAQIVAAVAPDETAVAPLPSRRSVQVAAELFNAFVQVARSLGHVPNGFAEPLAATLRRASVPKLSSLPREPLLVAPILQVILSDLQSGHRYDQLAGASLMDVLLCVLKRGDCLGADDPDVAAVALRVAAWLAASRHGHGDAEALQDAVAVACSRHSDSLGHVATDAWLEAQRCLDAGCVVGQIGHTSARRRARQARCVAERSNESWGPQQALLEDAVGIPRS